MTAEHVPHERGEPTGAELLLRSLAERGVERIYINPGTDTAPLQHAVALAAAAGRPGPALVLCPHETVALAAAHAHFIATGRVQAVLVHVDVGTQNLGSMVHNASRGGAGVIVLAGLTPYDESGTVPGGRDATVHWMQDVPDQHGIVRQYVKASFAPSRASLVHGTIHRAIDIASAEPSGIVYVTLGREMLMETAPEPAPARLTAPFAAGPGDDAVRASLEEIRASRHPVLVTTRVGRDPAAAASFTRFAELIGARVFDQRERMNLPGAHPLVVDPADAATVWAQADLAIVIDSPVPWIIGHAGPRPECRVLVVDEDPLQTTMPNWAFPADLRITSSPRRWLETIVGALEREGFAPAAPGPAEPGEPLASVGPPLSGPGDVLAPEHVLAAVAGRLAEDDRLIDEGATNSAAVARLIPRTLPGTLFRSGGSGLGWALGALLGIQLADPAGSTLAVVGDGGFMFGAPVAALTALRRAEVSGLVVVMQNGGYAASSRPVHELFPDRGDEQPAATVFGDDLDVAGIAAACGATGVSVSTRADLDGGLDRAVAAWRRRELVVVDAKVTSPWIEQHR